MTEIDTVTDIVRPLVESSGYDLYDVHRAGGTLAVLVEGPEGVDIDELSVLSRRISAALDEVDPIPGRYTLEVSSPGVERRLRRVEHYQGAVGEVVNIRTLPGPEGRRRIVGELSAVDGDIVTVQDREQGETRVRVDEIEKARTVFEWGPTPRPGGGKERTSGRTGDTTGGRGR